MGLEEEGQKRFFQKIFAGMMDSGKKAECIHFFETFLHQSGKKQNGIQDVLNHIKKGGDLNDETIRQNITALLSTTLQHERALSNLSCIVMMLIFSKEWDGIAASAGMKVGGEHEFLGAMFKNKFGKDFPL